MPSTSFSVAVTAALTGVSLGVLIYVIYRKSVANQAANNRRKHRSSGTHGDGKTEDVVTSEGFTAIKLTVPKEMVGAIIGRQGANIKQIQSETKTKIDFSKQTDEGPERTITIRGSEKGTQDAELKILHIVYGQPNKDVYVLSVPRGSLGFIIGKGGETIKKVQHNSKCHVKVNSDEKSTADVSDITITGIPDDIPTAVNLINELVSEWQAKQEKRQLSSKSRRPVTRKPRLAAPLFPGSPLPLEDWPDHADFVECYITATVNPTHIWVQRLSPSATKLEEINRKLTELYSDTAEFTDDVETRRPAVGTTVAARNSTDSQWYRGKISAYDDEDPDAVAVDIYYVDYGDSCWCPLENCSMQLLRPEFYDLPAQALECYTELAVSKDIPSEWSESICDYFETLCHVGSWKVIMASRISCKAKSHDHQDGVLPVISLIDTNSEVDINISERILAALSQEIGSATSLKSLTDQSRGPGDQCSGPGDQSSCPGDQSSGPADQSSGPAHRDKIEQLITQQDSETNQTKYFNDPLDQPSGPAGQPSGPAGQPSGPAGQPSGPAGQFSGPAGQFSNSANQLNGLSGQSNGPADSLSTKLPHLPSDSVTQSASPASRFLQSDSEEDDWD